MKSPLLIAALGAAAILALGGAAFASSSGEQLSLAPMALNSFSNPPGKIAKARVVDSLGNTIGAVQRVDMADGKPAQVEIALSGSGKIISIDARSVSYDVPSNVLMASQVQGEIGSTPQG